MPSVNKPIKPIKRPHNILFMLQSLDGKISTGDSDELDFDKDFPRVPGVLEGVEQFYEIEKSLPTSVLTTGKTLAKIGVNLLTYKTPKISSTYIVIDSKPHLNTTGLTYLAKWLKKLIIVTTHPAHPAYQLQKEYPNISLISFVKTIDFSQVFTELTSTHKIKELTIQAGGTLNAHLLRNRLIDKISIVIAPCLIGGTDTASLIGGESVHTRDDLRMIQALKLEKCTVLKNSYLHLQYNLRS